VGATRRTWSSLLWTRGTVSKARPILTVIIDRYRSSTGEDFMHCYENPIYVIPEKELLGLSPNSYIRLSVSDLYFPRI
jgi:hypothetical protein